MAAPVRALAGASSDDGKAAGTRALTDRTAPLPAREEADGGTLPSADECVRLLAATGEADAWRLSPSGADAAARVLAARLPESSVSARATDTNGGDWNGLGGRDALYTRGLSRFEAGDLDGAIVDFALVHASGPRTDEADPLAMPSALGIAAAAHASALHVEAAAIAVAVSETGFAHPRAHLLAGLAFIAAGQPDPGRRSLAVCARAARGDARYADERHAAQRALIGLQFGAPQNEA